MRQKTIILYKNEGETPLECLERLRHTNGEYETAVLSYVGRLDPMAEGLLLVVVDEENKEREKYLGLNKIYEVDILLGIKTDTGDILGKVTNQPVSNTSVILANAGTHVLKNQNTNPLGPRLHEDDTKRIIDNTYFQQVLNSFTGDITLPYPIYSSKTVNGKSLFEWAREGKIDEIEIPTKTSKIFSIKYIDSYSLHADEILKEATVRIAKVKGDFRQEEITRSWNEALQDREDAFQILRIEVASSSGTYMRSLAEAMVEKLGKVGIAWKIKRTKIGDFSSIN